MSLADIFNVTVDYLLGRSAISFKFDKLNKSFFGKFTIAEAIDILLLLIKKAVCPNPDGSLFFRVLPRPVPFTRLLRWLPQEKPPEGFSAHRF